MDALFLRYWRELFSIALASAIGHIAWCGRPEAIALSLAFPPLCLIQASRAATYLVAFSYYAGASWPLIPGARTFFGPPASVLLAIVLWIVASTILASPWGLLWTLSSRARVWRGPLALLVAALPPVGIIGWASPLTAAGVLFPGTGWFGIIAVLVLSGTLATFPCSSLLTVVFSSALAWTLYPGEPEAPQNWEVVNTNFGGSGFAARDPIAELTAADTIQRVAIRSHAQVVVFPETAVPRWNEAMEAFWHPTLAKIRKSGKTIAFGATVSTPGSDRFDNKLIIRGTQTGPDFLQRIPVPIGMWRPLGETGVRLHVVSPGTASIAGQRAAILICYEQLLVWPVVTSMVEQPAMILAISNDYWAVRTRIPAVKTAALKAWARLFRLSFLAAVNN